MPAVNAVLILCLTGMGFTIFMMRRNLSVHRYLKETLRKVGKYAGEDIKHKQDWMWRYQALESVSYETMLFHFWKPLDSFYTDKSFMEPGKYEKSS